MFKRLMAAGVVRSSSMTVVALSRGCARTGPILVGLGKEVTAPFVGGRIGVAMDKLGRQVADHGVRGRFADGGMEIADVLR